MQVRGRVSIVIATHDRAPLLQRAIGSLLNQTRVPDEIIVVDDGSTDATAELLADMRPPVIALRCEAAGGVSAARNAGLRRATGDYIGFLDDDDTLRSNSVEIRAHALDENPSYGVVYSDAVFVDSSGADVGRVTKVRATAPQTGDVFAPLLKRSFVTLHTALIRRSELDRVGYFEEALTSHEDYDLFLRLSERVAFLYLDQVLAEYHSTPASLSGDRAGMIRSNCAVRERAVGRARFASLTSNDQRGVLQYLARQYLVLGQSARARDTMARVRRLGPLDREGCVLSAASLLPGGVISAARRLRGRS